MALVWLIFRDETRTSGASQEFMDAEKIGLADLSDLIRDYERKSPFHELADAFGQGGLGAEALPIGEEARRQISQTEWSRYSIVQPPEFGEPWTGLSRDEDCFDEPALWRDVRVRSNEVKKRWPAQPFNDDEEVWCSWGAAVRWVTFRTELVLFLDDKHQHTVTGLRGDPMRWNSNLEAESEARLLHAVRLGSVACREAPRPLHGRVIPPNWGRNRPIISIEELQAAHCNPRHFHVQRYSLLNEFLPELAEPQDGYPFDLVFEVIAVNMITILCRKWKYSEETAQNFAQDRFNRKVPATVVSEVYHTLRMDPNQASTRGPLPSGHSGRVAKETIVKLAKAWLRARPSLRHRLPPDVQHILIE